MTAPSAHRVEKMDQEAWDGLMDSAESGNFLMRGLLMHALAMISPAGGDFAEQAAAAALIEILHYPVFSKAIIVSLPREQRLSPAAVWLAQDAARLCALAPEFGKKPETHPSPVDQRPPEDRLLSIIPRHVALGRLREAVKKLRHELMCADMGIDDRQRHQLVTAALTEQIKTHLDEIQRIEARV